MVKKNLTKYFWTLLLVPQVAIAADSFTSVTGGSCDSYECWIGKVWNWSLMIIIPLSIVMLTAAGIIYMTSAGDTNRIGTSKKLIVGVLSGLGLIILARVLLVNILGIDIAWNL